MADERKLKRRGFVMTGGGAKGLYEAGVIHAFHITGMEFDVITGSSIGAMNAVFFAEYLYQKGKLAAEMRADPARAVEALDELVKRFHHAWLLLPDKRIIDDSQAGPIGQLVADLTQFNLSLPQILTLLWWWTDPDRKAIPPPRVWPTLISLAKELAERLGGANEVLRILKDHRATSQREALRTYLARFNLEHSLIPAGDDQRISSIFSERVSPLAIPHLEKGVGEPSHEEPDQLGLVPGERTLGDYAQVGIDVRLTRANYRTGRLEVSANLSPEMFIQYMRRQAWRLQRGDPASIPLGSFRMQVPGNPLAINAALASGRFPGVFGLFPITRIYPLDRPENHLLKGMLVNWLEDAQVATELGEAFLTVYGDSAENRQRWDRLFASWHTSANMRAFFPHLADGYVDGGAIDNTPSNSAIDATREWVEREGVPKGEVTLELFTIWLHPEPRIDPHAAQDPTLFEVVGRTLDIQGAAKLSSDGVVVDTINTFGRRGQELGAALLFLVDRYRETLGELSEEQRGQAMQRVQWLAKEQGVESILHGKGELLERIEKWGQDKLNSLPLQVEMIKIYPERMPLSTLQFTERLGYRKQNAIEMLTMGCYNTLWALRSYLEDPKTKLDDRDRQVLGMAQNWMGIEDWPKGDEDQLEALRREWRCARTACVFHAQHCPHGAQRGSNI